MNKKIVWVLFIVIVCIGVSLRFSTSHESMPIGCDEFGYLNQAKAMDGGFTFEEHAHRPYLTKLLDTLRTSGITEYEIAWMIAPHAYHLIPETNKIINQYPPGTAVLLQLIPDEFRKILFPSFVLLILILLPLIAVWKVQGNALSWFHPLFAIFIFVVTISPPFITELSRINSLAFTFGLLLAAGILLRKFPLWSCVLVALTINFRVANVLMLVPLFLYTLSSLKQLVNFKIIFSFVVCSVVAILPLLIYNYYILGNPFTSTYSAIDQSFAGFVYATKSLRYYFNIDQYWLRVHLIAIIVLAGFVLLKKLKWIEFIKLMLFPLINYIFFVFHFVNMDYYPYASAMILTGVSMQLFAEIKLQEKFTTISFSVICVIALIISVSGIRRYMKRTHVTYTEAKNEYSALCKFDIVWADLYSGTSEYVCDNNGFRFGTTTPQARKIAMKFLHDNNYKQAILIDDNTVSPEIIISEVKSAGLEFVAVSDKKIGKFIIIE